MYACNGRVGSHLLQACIPIPMNSADRANDLVKHVTGKQRRPLKAGKQGMCSPADIARSPASLKLRVAPAKAPAV